MKKLIYTILSFTLLGGYLISCESKDGPDKKMRDFAEKIAKFSISNRRDSIMTYYPGFEKTDSLKRLDTEKIKLEPTQPDGYWKVEYSHGEYMNVLLSQDGKMTIKDSHGLFAYPDYVESIAKKKGIWDDREADIKQARKIDEMLDEWTTFSSPDLTFFNLNAPVKSVTISYENSDTDVFQHYWGWPGTYTFDEQGVWNNSGNIKLDNAHPLLKVERGQAGEIAKIFFKETSTWDGEADYLWEEEQPLGVQSHYGSYQGMFTFHPDGLIDQFTFSNGETEGISGSDTVLSDFVIDAMGNWVECNWAFQEKEPVPYYSAVTGALVGYKDQAKGEPKKGKIKREIRYYFD